MAVFHETAVFKPFELFFKRAHVPRRVKDAKARGD